MGLDNIPVYYACDASDSAILGGDGRIDCRVTQVTGGCTLATSNLGKRATTGIFSTDCWYPGESGNSMIRAVVEAGASLPDDLNDGFYGPYDTLTPEYCRDLAEWMAQHRELYLTTVPESERETAGHEYEYAVHWLRWTAEHCGGANAWW